MWASGNIVRYLVNLLKFLVSFFICNVKILTKLTQMLWGQNKLMYVNLSIFSLLQNGEGETSFGITPSETPYWTDFFILNSIKKCWVNISWLSGIRGQCRSNIASPETWKQCTGCWDHNVAEKLIDHLNKNPHWVKRANPQVRLGPDNSHSSI
jgi:hypothetical protein